MRISSDLATYYASSISSNNYSNYATDISGQSTPASSSTDTVEFSPLGMERAMGTPPPPPSSDELVNMTDDEFMDYLSEYQEKEGSIPGVSKNTSVDDLTESELESLRSNFTDMASQVEASRTGSGNTPPPQPSMDIEFDSSEVNGNSNDLLMQTLRNKTLQAYEKNYMYQVS